MEHTLRVVTLQMDAKFPRLLYLYIDVFVVFLHVHNCYISAAY